MNRVVNFLQKYFAVISVLIGISILLSVTFSSYIVTSNNHKAAEMYIGELKYSMEIDGTATNTLMVPTGETIIDVKVNNLNPVDTYYKLLYLKNTNITVKYFETTKDTSDVVTTYNKPNDSITSSNSNTIKLLIRNNSESSQNVAFTMKGGYITNTLQDITTPSTYSEITLADTSTNTYFCKTNSTLTQGLNYNNGQYTYAYKQEGINTSEVKWQDISNDGWGVQLTDRASTDAVTSKLCTYINDKPVTSMAYIFRCPSRDAGTDAGPKIVDLTNFNTSNVTNMKGMFYSAKFTSIDVSSLDTSNVINMSYMFGYARATSLNLNGLNTSKVTDMSSMFWATYDTSLDLSMLDTSKVTTMNRMFYAARSTSLDLSNFDTSNVTDMGHMFINSYAKTIDVSSFNTSKVTNMEKMFSTTNVTSIDASNFDTSNVTNMAGMFGWSAATVIDISSFDTSKVTDMSSMFSSPSTTSAPLKTIYVSSKFVTTAVTESSNMFQNSANLVGGAGTKYNSSYIDKTYARIDGGTSNPGYFTDAANKPSTFPTDDWATIVASVKAGNTRGYKVGETKTVDMGTYGTHTLRIANTSTPTECSTSGFSQTACGFVLEFADIITTHKMNNATTNVGGWPATAMRTFVNNDIYNSLPSDLKNGIIDTVTVSGHGSTSGETNFTSTDKLYLLSTAEVWAQGSSNTTGNDTARDNTRQLDYYKNIGVTTNNYSGAIKKNGTSASYWWLRSASSSSSGSFYGVSDKGDWGGDSAYGTNGVAPAFRLG